MKEMPLQEIKDRINFLAAEGYLQVSAGPVPRGKVNAKSGTRSQRTGKSVSNPADQERGGNHRYRTDFRTAQGFTQNDRPTRRASSLYGFSG
jgi:hypothetical protein